MKVYLIYNHNQGDNPSFEDFFHSVFMHHFIGVLAFSHSRILAFSQSRVSHKPRSQGGVNGFINTLVKHLIAKIQNVFRIRTS
jgi:hypothetical protein